jgi:Caspase domain
VVGIDQYDNFPPLKTAVNDAQRIARLLERNDDRTLNYGVREMVTGGKTVVSRELLRAQWLKLFEHFRGDVLFYFSGHGVQTPWGAYLVTQDGTRAEPGLPMEQLLLLANRSRARDIVVILDCCYSGDLGNPPLFQDGLEPLSLLREGVTILAASRPTEASYGKNSYGLFTDAIADGLSGGAADLLGQVNAASLYLYADRLFGGWNQRPMYKSHTSEVSRLRLCKPMVSGEVLRSIKVLFPQLDDRLQLTPKHASAFNPSDDDPDAERKYQEFQELKKLRDAGVVMCDGDQDLETTAKYSGYAQMTILGRYLWRLLDSGNI